MKSEEINWESEENLENEEVNLENEEINSESEENLESAEVNLKTEEVNTENEKVTISFFLTNSRFCNLRKGL